MLADAEAGRHLRAKIRRNGKEQVIKGRGNGPIDAFIDALRGQCGIDLAVTDYREHAVTAGSSSQAAAYVQIRANGGTPFGVGLDENIVTPPLPAGASAAARAAAPPPPLPRPALNRPNAPPPPPLPGSPPPPP